MVPSRQKRQYGPKVCHNLPVAFHQMHMIVDCVFCMIMEQLPTGALWHEHGNAINQFCK